MSRNYVPLNDNDGFVNEVKYVVKSQHLILGSLFHRLSSFLIAVILVLLWVNKTPLIIRLIILLLFFSIYILLVIVRYFKTYPRVELTATHIRAISGVWNRKEKKYAIDAIMQIQLYRPLLCRWLASGSIQIYAFNMENPIIVIKDQRNPELVANYISKWQLYYKANPTKADTLPPTSSTVDYVSPERTSSNYKSN